MTQPRAALYARVSTADQTLDPQLDELRALAARRGWHVIGEYTDHGVSGAKERRPALDRLVQDSHRGRFDILAVVKFDRFARSLRHLVMALDDLTSRGISFVSTSDAVDSSTPGGRFQVQILGAVAEFERELIRQRTIAGLVAARRKGRRLGRAPTTLDADQLFQLQAQGLSVRKIADALGVSKSLVSKRLSAVHKSPPDLATGAPKNRLSS